MKKINRILVIIGCIMLGYILLYLLTINIKSPYIDYFRIPISSVFSLSIAIGISYFLVQANNDSRKRKDILGILINKLIEDISQPFTSKITDFTQIQKLRFIYRSSENRLMLMKTYKEEFQLEPELSQVKELLTDYWQRVSDHIHDLNYLQKIEIELSNYVYNITSRLERMYVNLYR